MLCNFDNIDYDFLKGSYKKLSLESNNQIIDGSKKAKEIGLKKHQYLVGKYSRLFLHLVQDRTHFYLSLLEIFLFFQTFFRTFF